ncbi:integrating conjugative element protein [Diaphorobacter sp. HDW4A]|nr:integrating conjugative element protein [Diaphorobacter sp. HDW4A]
MSSNAHAQPVRNSSLYYRMGGASPGGSANYRGQAAHNLSLGANLRLNYSCGKFDIGLSWTNIMNNLSKLGQTVTNAIQSGIAALPMYILQRAQPGLYQLFQNYSQKVDLLTSAGLKSCEEMEAMIKAGKDPYEDWMKMAKGDAWKIKASGSGDVYQSKIDIEKNEAGNKAGIPWVFGKRAGGVDSSPIEPIKDLSIAGYNATINKAVTASSVTDYSASTAEKNSRLVRAFSTPETLAKWATDVLGDQRVYTCSEEDCPKPTTVTTASGLGPKYEAEVDTVMPKLQTLATPSTTASYAELAEIAAPGFGVSPQLLDAVRRLPTETRNMAVNRLGQEMAMHRVIDKALVARAVLLTGLSLPEVMAAGDALRTTQDSIDRLTRYIDDLMYEAKIRKELTSNTALSIMSDQFVTDSRAMQVPDGTPAEKAPLTGGRVKP